MSALINIVGAIFMLGAVAGAGTVTIVVNIFHRRGVADIEFVRQHPQNAVDQIYRLLDAAKRLTEENGRLRAALRSTDKGVLP